MRGVEHDFRYALREASRDPRGNPPIDSSGDLARLVKVDKLLRDAEGSLNDAAVELHGVTLDGDNNIDAGIQALRAAEKSLDQSKKYFRKAIDAAKK